MNKIRTIEESGSNLSLEIAGKASDRFRLILSRKNRDFQVLDFVCVNHPERTVAFIPSSAVEVLDTTSDSAQCLNRVHKVRVGSVVLGTDSMRANSVEELAAALAVVSLSAYDPEEI